MRYGHISAMDVLSNSSMAEHDRPHSTVQGSKFIHIIYARFLIFLTAKVDL